MTKLLLFSLGIILASLLPDLPSIYITFSLLFLALIAWLLVRKKFPLIVPLSASLIGVCFGLLSGHKLLALQLPENLVGQDVVVEGKVIDLPQENSRRQLFTFEVARSHLLHHPESILEKFPDKINVSSYTNLRVKTGELWRLTVKLKRPRGFVNPGGFDYQISLLRRGVGATGYIREGDNSLLQTQSGFSMDMLRYELQQWLINKSRSNEKGILVALLVGDTSLVDKDHWGEMLKTGTNHLIAISGLHLGFFAIVGFFIGNLIGRFVQLLWHRYPSMLSGYIFSVTLTLFYSLVAGFNIPTIRTLIMLAVVQLALLFRRSFRARDTLLIALVLVLLYDPWAAYDIGFWLSFSAVAILIFCFTGRISPVRTSDLTFSGKRNLFIFVKSQWIMFVGLLIPLAIFVHTSSLLAPPANFIAIPVITFFVVPCLILSAVFHFALPSFEYFFLRAAEWGISFVHEWLNYLLIAGNGKFNPLVNFNFWAIGLASLSVFLILLPRGIGNKFVGILGLIISLCLPLKQLPDLHMLVFDVGQGTAIFIRTPNHQMLYDTGPIYTENFDAGSGIIVPYLHGLGVKSLDALVVSHNDLDHSGGLEGILAATHVDNLWLGEPEKLRPDESGAQPKNCHEQEPWQWDHVSFRFISWPIQDAAKANNHSCVLMIEYKGHRILLAGDIEKDVERVLLAQESLSKVDILLAPHHGSHSSSTVGFVAQVQPQTVIYSAGFNNQHGHPHADIQARYKSMGAVPLNTAYDGALEFIWQAEESRVVQYRHAKQRYWFDTNTTELKP